LGWMEWMIFVATSSLCSPPIRMKLHTHSRTREQRQSYSVINEWPRTCSS
jgi:hypothetical protein